MSNDYKKIADSFIELIKVLRKLREPGGCDWDRKQTSQSLTPYLLEEVYEVIESIEENNIDILKEELGDLALHILFQAEIARDSNQFDISDSLNHISDKLISRHPHIFDSNYSLEKNNNESWEIIKQKEKKRENLLDGVPKTLPALLRARRVQEKAANVGFDWKKISPVMDKIDEEINELKKAISENDINNIINEMGDVLFSIVNLSRFLNINPENSLRISILKFEKRFSLVEDELKKRGKKIEDSSLEEMDEIWEAVKKKAQV